jgi:Lipase (class 3)
MSTPTYTPLQTLFTLSILSDLGHAFTGSVAEIETELTAEIQKQLSNLQPQIGPWQLVWGPAVYELPLSDRPDNIMLVARNAGVPGLPQLVVSIAGTNPYSFLDWIVEDFLVSPPLIPWFSGHPFAFDRGTSLGAFTGLSILQALRPGPGQPGAGTTVRDFLATQVAAPTAINLGGHSLGGALSPTLALWLHDTQGDWDPAGHASLSALPSAGPTAGNQQFAAYSDAHIGAQVTRIHNPLDIVPHAWAAADVQAIPTLYVPQIQPDDVVNSFVALLSSISVAGNYAQIDAGAPPLAGAAVDPTKINPGDPAFVNFFTQASYQHVDAYFQLLGVPKVTTLMAPVKASAAAAGPTDVLGRLQIKLAKFRAATGQP